MKEQFGYRVWKTLLQKLSSPRKATQLDKLSEIDWDILVVLDACRADVLEQVVGQQRQRFRLRAVPPSG